MKPIKILSLIAMAMLLSQCYPAGPDYIDEVDLVYTNYDATYDFAPKKFYAMPDKVMKLDDDLIAGTDTNYIQEPYNTYILQAIQRNMSAYGYTQVSVSDTGKTDLILAPASIESTTLVYYDPWYYYGGWYGGYYPYYGGGYYGYPVVYDSYTTGSLVVAMVDPKDRTANDRARVAWTFIVNGLLEGSSSTAKSRIDKTINQAFTQSPYLKK